MVNRKSEITGSEGPGLKKMQNTMIVKALKLKK